MSSCITARRRRHSLQLFVFLFALGMRQALQHTFAADSVWLDIARASVTSGELSEHVYYLAADMLEGREAGSRGGHAAAKYILNRLQDLEMQGAAANESMVQPFHGNYQNLLVKIPGTDPALQNEVLLVTAHYDHVGYGNRTNSYGPFGYIHNGADDNASGVSALLELVDALGRTSHRPRRTIVFAFWDGEEQGLLGSEYWTRNPTMPLSSVKLCLNVDMVGRLSSGKFEVGGTRCGDGFRRLMSSPTLQGTAINFSWDYKENSDHWSFFKKEIPALYVHTGLHSDYHRPSDDVEKIDFAGMEQVTRYLLERISVLADVDQLPSFRRQARREKSYAQVRLEKPLPALESRVNFEAVPIASEPDKLFVSRIQGTAGNLKIRDRIIAVEGRRPVDEALLQHMILTRDNKLTLTVQRASEPQPIEVEVSLKGNPTKLGISWREDAAELGTVFITRVVPYSPAARAGLALKDRIHAIDDTPFSDRHELLRLVQERLKDGATVIHFEVETRGAIHMVEVQLSDDETHAKDTTL